MRAKSISKENTEKKKIILGISLWGVLCCISIAVLMGLLLLGIIIAAIISEPKSFGAEKIELSGMSLADFKQETDISDIIADSDMEYIQVVSGRQGDEIHLLGIRETGDIREADWLRYETTGDNLTVTDLHMEDLEEGNLWPPYVDETGCLHTVYYYYEYRDSAYRYWMYIFDRNGKRIETIDLSGEVHILTDHNDKYIHHIYPYLDNGYVFCYTCQKEHEHVVYLSSVGERVFNQRFENGVKTLLVTEAGRIIVENKDGKLTELIPAVIP